jgi:hypothetical protein
MIPSRRTAKKNYSYCPYHDFIRAMQQQAVEFEGDGLPAWDSDVVRTDLVSPILPSCGAVARGVNLSALARQSYVAVYAQTNFKKYKYIFMTERKITDKIHIYINKGNL